MSSSLRRIEAFLRNNAAAFSIKEVKIQDRLGPAYFNFICTLAHQGTKAQGFGTAHGRSEAFLAAVGEAMERYFFQQQDRYVHSNGFAAHSCLDQAVLRAKRELIERDAFLCIYHLRRPIQDITASLKEEGSDRIKNLLARIEGAGLKARCGLLREGNYPTVVAVVYPVREGGVLGLGCKESRDTAAEKALLEAFINAYPRPSVSSLKLEDFAELPREGSVSPLLHYRLGLDREMMSTFQKQLVPGDLSEAAPIAEDGFVFELLETGEFFPDCPFFVVKASHPQLQDLYFGRDVSARLHRERLQAWGPGPVHELPHILG